MQHSKLRSVVLFWQSFYSNQQKTSASASVVLLAITLLSYPHPFVSKPAKLSLFDGIQRYSIDSKSCQAGIFATQPTSYRCACVTGVWGLYETFCAEPFSVIGGDNFCQLLPSTKISQAMVFGHPKSAFEASISHFAGKFNQMTSYFLHDDDTVELDGDSTFVTITDTAWTIFGDSGSSICLKATKRGSRIFCMFGSDLRNTDLSISWKQIVKIRKGCFGNSTYYADNCSTIELQNDGGECNVIPLETTETPCNGTNCSEEWFHLPHKNKSTVETSTLEPWWIPLPRNSTFPTPTSTTTTESPVEEDPCKSGISRESVKAYWRSSSTKSCPPSVTQAVFTDQLRRFATLQMDKVLPSRLRCLLQLEKLLNLSLRIMQTTCPDEVVSAEFLRVTMEAFFMFVKEDFFYGMNEANKEAFDRIESSLEMCLATATPFAFETTQLDCQFNQINAALILPGERKVLTVPDTVASHHYETLIESAWKIFLNAHSYCFKHFHTSNDHHHFSVFIMEAFTKSIFEKWIDPPSDTELYSLVVPNFKYLKETMMNIDYCVAATSIVSQCPTWLTRSKRNSKIANKRRRKRSAWITNINKAREEASIWNGTAYCLHNMDDPESKLNLVRCSHPLKR